MKLRHRQHRTGRVVLWGSAYKLDVQCGSPRDRALEAVAQREARWDRVLQALMARSVENFRRAIEAGSMTLPRE